MKDFSRLILAAAMLACLNVKLLADEGTPAGLAVSSELDIVSKYVWRGIALSKAEAYQPSVNLSKDDLTLNAWLNYSVDKPRRSKFNELDLTLSYERDVAGFSVSPGFILYTFTYSPHYGEAYVKLSHPAAFLKVLTDHYFSMINGSSAGGYYGDAGLGYEKSLAGYPLFTGSALLGWGNSKFNSFNYSTAGMTGHLNVLILDASATFKACGGATLRPHLTYYDTLPRAVKTAAGSRPDNLVFGIAADYDFR